MVIRTKFFDEVLEGKFSPSNTPAKQIVILASGMDTRFLRLNVPSGILRDLLARCSFLDATIYEVDFKDVLDYKMKKIGDHEEFSQTTKRCNHVRFL